MENPYAPPSASTGGDNLGADDVKLRRDTPHPNPTDNALSIAWEHVKRRPVETVLLAAVSTFFGGGRCQTTNPSGLQDLGQTGGYNDGYNDYQYNDYDYFSDIDPQAIADVLPGADIFGLPQLVGQMGGAELGIIAGVLFFILIVGFVFFVLGVAAKAVENIYWLRILRGQKADLGLCLNVGKFIIPICVAQILVTIGALFGFVLLIIPGIILTFGWSFVQLVGVDKGLGMVDALKASWRITHGYKMDLLVLAILSFFLTIAGILACCVGLFAVFPVINGAVVIAYNRIAEPGNAYLAAGESPGDPRGGMGGFYDEPSLGGDASYEPEQPAHDPYADQQPPASDDPYGGQQPPASDDPYGSEW